MSECDPRRIRYFLPVCERLACGGQPTAEQFAGLHAAGYEVIINLLPSELPSALPSEPEIVSNLGMEYVHIPVVWTRPTCQDLDCFFAAMDAAHATERKTFVHCAVNKRASTFLYLYRILRAGIDPDEAEGDLHDIWVPEGWWQDFIEDRIRAYSASGRPA